MQYRPAVPIDELRLMAPTSVWNRPLSATAQLDPSSQVRIDHLDQEVGREIAVGHGPTINATSYSTPIYVVGRHQPRVHVSVPWWRTTLQDRLKEGVPIPENAHPAAGTDAQMTIYQPATETLWEFERAAYVDGRWTAVRAGVITGVSKSPGYYRTRRQGRRIVEDDEWGASATGLPLIAGTILVSELERGSIDHALAMAVPLACRGWFAWPAQRTDGTTTGKSCMPEGAHLRLNPQLNLSSLHLPRITYEIADAAQRYGVIVRDTTHYDTVFFAQDPTPLGYDPYIERQNLYEGQSPYRFLRQFPWNELQVLRLDPCHSTPCARG